MRILGLSAYYHDSAAALIVDGDIVAAAQEERFTRKKHDASFPRQAIDYCLYEGGFGLDKIDYVAFYDKPFLKFERLLETYLAFAPKGLRSFRKGVPVWLKEKLFQKRLLADELGKLMQGFDIQNKVLFAEHHQSHGASAFYPSPFNEALVLTMDGVGEWATTSVAIGQGSTLTPLKEIFFPHSVGLLYSAFTYYLGFKVTSGEYKVMGLAPYGEPKYKDLILRTLVDVKQDGTFWLDQRYFDYCTGLAMTNARFDALFGASPRKPEEDLTQRHMDIAASIQAVTEDIVLKLTRSLASETGLKNLCLAGGVALNCVANGKIARSGVFERIWIQPAAGDAGGAIGAAFAAWHQHLGGPRIVPAASDAMKGAYLGPAWDDTEAAQGLKSAGAVFETLSDEALLLRAASDLAGGAALGWMQGRMEFGPRALGNRSILGDARSPSMQSVLNLKVKYRESFRPFAPAVLREDVAQWFEHDEDSPYMLLVDNIAPHHRRRMTPQEEALFGIAKLKVPRSDIPAVTHVDYSARIQTVHADTNPRFHALLTQFKDQTGCPVLVNTSFNVRGEPIVCTPEDAFRCFMGTEIEALAVGNCYLRKERQNTALKQDYKHAFNLD
jgi:carbamoyltransferase